MSPASPLVAVGIDAGSRTTRCVMVALEESRLRLIGWGQVASEGWLRGAIDDPGRVSKSIREAVEQAERMSGLAVESAVVGIGGLAIYSGNARGVCELGHHREINRSDLRRSIERAARLQFAEDSMLYHVAPQNFIVDESPPRRNPVGLAGSRLEAYVHVVLGSVEEHKALVGAVNAAHIEVEETVFEPIAAAYSAITPGERQQCIALLDIGAETSGLAIYEGDALLSAVSLPVSADHFTRDISVGLKIRYIDAEQLKVQYGCAIMGLTNDHVFVALPQAPGREPRDIALYEVNYILQERAAELFDHLLAELERIGVERNLMGGLVITGGGAALPGLLDMATRTLNCEARYGLTVAIDEWPDAMDNPQWTAAGGLAMYSARLKQRQQEDRGKRGFVTRFLLGGQ